MEILYTGGTLKMKDTIKEGIFKGEKVGKVIKTYGKKGIWDILKSYDLDEEILKKYHFHKKKDEQKDEVQENTNVSKPQEYVSTKTLDWDHIDDDYWYEKYLKEMGGEQEEEMSDDEDPYEEYVGDPNPCPQNDDVSIFGPWPGDRNCFL